MVNGVATIVGFVEKLDGTARFATTWLVEVQPASAGPRVAATPTVRITQRYIQNLVAQPAEGFFPHTATAINRRGQILVAALDRDRKTLYALVRPITALGTYSLHYTPSDDVAPSQRTGIYAVSEDAPDCRIFSRAKNDPKDVREEGKHGKDNPLPYDPNRLYRCEP